MFLFELKVPISSYYGDEVFQQSVFFISNDGFSPSKETVIAVLRERHEQNIKDDEHGLYHEDWKEAADICESCKDFPSLYPGMSLNSTRVNHPKFGDQPISIQVREVVDMRSGIPVTKTEF